MKNLTKTSTFALNYLQNVKNRDNSKNNEFMNGQLECANHAMDLIAELQIQILNLEDTIKHK